MRQRERIIILSESILLTHWKESFLKEPNVDNYFFNSWGSPLCFQGRDVEALLFLSFFFFIIFILLLLLTLDFLLDLKQCFLTVLSWCFAQDWKRIQRKARLFFVLTRLYTLRHAKSYDPFVFKSVVNELKHPETSTNVTKFWETCSFYREEEEEEETTKKNWSTFYDLEQKKKWTRKSYNSDSMGSKSRFVVSNRS